jgi:hypothetical protein
MEMWRSGWLSTHVPPKSIFSGSSDLAGFARVKRHIGRNIWGLDVFFAAKHHSFPALSPSTASAELEAIDFT